MTLKSLAAGLCPGPISSSTPTYLPSRYATSSNDSRGCYALKTLVFGSGTREKRPRRALQSQNRMPSSPPESNRSRGRSRYHARNTNRVGAKVHNTLKGIKSRPIPISSHHSTTRTVVDTNPVQRLLGLQASELMKTPRIAAEVSAVRQLHRFLAVLCAVPALFALSTPSHCRGLFPSNNKFVFDAQTRTFKQKADPLHAGGRVSLTVVNVNTFREKYTLKLEGTDYHTIAPFGPLQNLIATGKSNTITLPNAIIPYNVVGLDRSKLEAFISAHEQFEHAVGYLIGRPNVTIRAAIQQGTTNAEIRQMVVEGLLGPLHELLKSEEDWSTSLMLNLPEGTSDAIASAKEIVKPKKDVCDDESEFRAQSTAIATAGEALAGSIGPLEDILPDLQQKLETTYQALGAKPDSALGRSIVRLHDSAMAQYALYNKDHDKNYASAIANAGLLRNLLRDFTDPRIVPACITREASVQGDSVAASVQIESVPGTTLVADASASGGGGVGDSSDSGGGGKADVGADKAKGDDKSKGSAISAAPAAPSGSSKTYSASVPVFMRFTLDVSAGLARTSLKQRSYYLEPVANADGTKTSYVREGPADRINGGPTILGHIALTTPLPVPRSPIHLSPALSLGATVTDPVRYLLGYSVILDFRQSTRLVFTWGTAWGKLNVLNGDVVGQPALGSAVSTTGLMQRGNFSALTLAIAL